MPNTAKYLGDFSEAEEDIVMYLKRHPDRNPLLIILENIHILCDSCKTCYEGQQIGIDPYNIMDRRDALKSARYVKMGSMHYGYRLEGPIEEWRKMCHNRNCLEAIKLVDKLDKQNSEKVKELLYHYKEKTTEQSK